MIIRSYGISGKDMDKNLPTSCCSIRFGDGNQHIQVKVTLTLISCSDFSRDCLSLLIDIIGDSVYLLYANLCDLTR